MDKLVINDIKLTTLIGIHPWEKQCPQTLVLDIILQTDAVNIAKDDDITKAIDYDKVIQQILTFVENHHFQLIETLAHHIALEILENFATPWVHITLHKPGALVAAKDVAIVIERTKND